MQARASESLVANLEGNVKRQRFVWDEIPDRLEGEYKIRLMGLSVFIYSWCRASFTAFLA